MLEFYYDFMDVYIQKGDFEYCEMDTDSACTATSGSCFEHMIKPEIKERYLNGSNGFSTDDTIEVDSHFHWFPRTCCQKHAKFDKQTPGLFTLQYQGNEMIGLCCKTYVVCKSKIIQTAARVMAYHLLRKSLKLKRKKQSVVHELKISSKGVGKRAMKAPLSKVAQSGLICGFRVRNNQIYTYMQE